MIICIIGKSCAGKTTVAKELEQQNLSRIITTTTRPKRKNEKDNIDYHFIGKKVFREMLLNNDFLESDCFRGWYYGTAIEDIKDNSVIVLTPRGAKKLRKYCEEKGINLIIYYLDVPAHIRLKRALNRGDDPHEIIRRYYADELDFYNIFNELNKYYHRIKKSNKKYLIKYVKV